MITLDDMREKLLTLDQVRETLSSTEPLSEYPFEAGNAEFVLSNGWNHGLDSMDDGDEVDASVFMGGHEIPLTKEAILQAASVIGLSSAYVKKTPAMLIEPQLNYWFGTAGISGRPRKLLAVKGLGTAISPMSIKPFSNLRILDSVIEGIEAKGLATESEILVDSKFHHSLSGTYLRLILPEQTFTVPGTDVDEDQWFLGINVYNSLIGNGQTEINGYMFRWWCTNGAIDTKCPSSVWARSAGSGDYSPEEVYDWARSAVDAVFEPLRGVENTLFEMTQQSIEGNVNQILEDLFEDYGIPARDKRSIIASMVEDDDLTMYSLMQSVTDAANADGMNPKEQAKLMSVGGELPHRVSHRCDSCHRLTKPA